MSKYISVYRLTIFGILLFFCLSLRKAWALHDRYPDPPIRTCRYGESIGLGSYRMTFSGWEWGDGSLVKEKFPDYILVYPREDGLAEDARVGLICFTVTKTSPGGDILDFTAMGFSSGAWGNQFDLELFYLLNPELNSPFLDLPDGGTQEVILPLILLESQFTEEQWEEIDSREFYVNIQYYPEHIRFLCPCGGRQFGRLCVYRPIRRSDSS